MAPIAGSLLVLVLPRHKIRSPGNASVRRAALLTSDNDHQAALHSILLGLHNMRSRSPTAEALNVSNSLGGLHCILSCVACVFYEMTRDKPVAATTRYMQRRPRCSHMYGGSLYYCSSPLPDNARAETSQFILFILTHTR